MPHVSVLEQYLRNVIQFTKKIEAMEKAIEKTM